MVILYLNQIDCIRQIEVLSNDITELMIHISQGLILIPQDFFDRLARFTGLKTLMIVMSYDSPYTAVDLGFLESLTLLEELWISQLAITSVESFAYCPLKRLCLKETFSDREGNFLPTSLEFLVHCPLLVKLSLSYTLLAGGDNEQFPLSSLRHTPLLTDLTLDSCYIESLDGIQNCPGLETLKLYSNDLTSVERLCDSSCLKKLSILHGKLITSLNGIEFCQHLEDIALTPDCLASLMPLDMIPALKIIRLHMGQEGFDRLPERMNRELKFFVSKSVEVINSSVLNMKMEL